MFHFYQYTKRHSYYFLLSFRFYRSVLDSNASIFPFLLTFQIVYSLFVFIRIHSNCFYIPIWKKRKQSFRLIPIISMTSFIQIRNTHITMIIIGYNFFSVLVFCVMWKTIFFSLFIYIYIILFVLCQKGERKNISGVCKLQEIDNYVIDLQVWGMWQNKNIHLYTMHAHFRKISEIDAFFSFDSVRMNKTDTIYNCLCGFSFYFSFESYKCVQI